MDYEEAFRTWLSDLHRELDYPDPEAPPPWIRAAFEANGEIPAKRFAVLAFERRLEDITRAFTQVSAAARADTGIDVPGDFCPEEPSADFPVGMLSFGGSAIWSAEPPEVYVEVAEALQTYLADRHRRVWPLCPAHRTGTHPGLSSDHPVWWCAPGDHAAIPIP
ncbi:hypothetical protein [Streptomyces sp. SUK 48]|uniref:hypothetical protein n=1 Tax=Streptomyces sp. SUK 48 TaxID=2582831 RepID=UPI00129A5983|nr:hypothetical protein [Streptomyces sp. SUK 48]